jgi:hypothetical protein
MIKALRPGMRVLLSGGNIVRLLRCERGEWICEYTDLARARGEVVFTSAFLRRHGVQV